MTSSKSPLPGCDPAPAGKGYPSPGHSGDGGRAVRDTGKQPGRGDPENAMPPRPGQDAIAAAMTEDRGRDSLEANMRRLVTDLGLWGYHPRRSERSEKGWPDWVIIGSRIIYRELKTERGKVTVEQQAVGAMITAAGGDWDVWRPRDLLSGRIAAELAAISRYGAAA